MNYGLLRDGVAGRPAFLPVHDLETVDSRIVLVETPDADLLSRRASISWEASSSFAPRDSSCSSPADSSFRDGLQFAPIHRLAELVGSAEEGNLDFHCPTTHDVMRPACSHRRFDACAIP